MRQEHRSAQPQPDERHGAGVPARRACPFSRPGRLRCRRRSGGRSALHRYGLSAAQSILDGIYDNVAFGLRLNRYKGNLNEKVEHALRRAALWDEVKDKLKASGLSLLGGQQQRLCIARAIATDPTVLLMDEPCSALDPIAARRIEELSLELKHEHTLAPVTRTE